MGLVKFALKFRISIYVLSLLILLAGVGAIVTMPKDVLPNVDIPVVSIIWTYTGLDTREMEQRVTTYSEFSLSNNVNGIKNIESQTLQGVAIEKVYFQPDVSIDLAIAQIVASVNSIRAVMPPGIQPPIVVRYSASAVPVIQLSLSSDTESEQQLFDYGQYRVRQAITSTPGATLPAPFGGKQRQVMVDLDLHALQGLGLAPTDVVNAITAQNLTEPSGQAKIGNTQYHDGAECDAHHHRGAEPHPDQGRERRPGAGAGRGLCPRRLPGAAEHRAPERQARRPADGAEERQRLHPVGGEHGEVAAARHSRGGAEGLKITPLFDQSVFVSSAINDVLREGGIAAGLTGLMILMFLGSWRSTLIVLISIPLSILTSLVVLAVLGETLNIMTLGGLALAVGILVDDATVAIENTYRLMEEGKPFRNSVVEGAAGIAKPALISTLSICCAFVSVLFLNGRRQVPVHAAGAGGGVRDAGLIRPVADAGAGDDRRAGEEGVRRAPRRA